MFADDMILYIENSKDATRKLLGLINEYSKAAGCKLIHRNPLHSYTLAMKKTEREIKGTIPFTIATKSIKYLGISLVDLFMDSQNCRKSSVVRQRLPC